MSGSVLGFFVGLVRCCGWLLIVGLGGGVFRPNQGETVPVSASQAAEKRTRQARPSAMRLSYPTAWLAIAMSMVRPAYADSALDQLLQQVQQTTTASTQQDKEREQRFLANRNEQAALTQKAEAELAAAKAAADAAKSRYDTSAKSIAELKKQLDAKAGDYTQVFAAARQAAGDFQAQAMHTMVTAQHPQRLAFLDKMAHGADVPSIADLNQLWFTLQQEMTDTASSARFTAQLVEDDGSAKPTTVVRVGAFSIFADGRYLALTPDGLGLRPLARQPGGDARSIARTFAAAKSGYAGALIDPTRGQLLAREAERPTIFERIHQGGIVGYVIIAVGLAGFVLAAWQFLFLTRVSIAVRRQLRNPQAPSPDNPLGRVLAALGAPDSAEAVNAELLETRLTEAVLREVPPLERFQSLLRLIVAAGPLLGLVGTVSGMIITFQVITELGAGDPKVMAGGISQAMIATVLGLGIAIPLLFVNSILTTRSRALVNILEEQAAGLLARQLESRG